MPTKSFLLSLLLACSILLYPTLAIPKPFPYQAHSFNDLNIASQLLRKGVQYFKFDASLANEQSCTLFSTWDRKNSCISSNEYAEQMCCLAMRGDASSAPNFHYPFNTSSQFVTLLDNFLSEHEHTIDILFIAIDFQFGFSFSNTLAEQFMTGLAALMSKYNKLHVTTKGDYILEYDRVCRYYGQGPREDGWEFALPMSQDSQGCTPQRNQISQSRFFLQSPSMNLNDPRDYKGRYQNFNIIYTEIDRLCQSGFPSWINRNPSFPLIFWEPSNEEQIQSSLRKLMNPQCQRKHNRSLSGIALASNIDPEMFQIAMKETGSGLFQRQFPWHFQQKKLWLENVTSVKMTKVSNKDQEMLVLYRKVEAFNQTRTSISSLEHYLALLSLQPNLNSVVLEREIEIHQQALELRGMRDRFILVTQKNGTKSSTRDFDAVLIAYNMRLEPTALLPVGKFITSFASSEDFFFISLSSNPQVLITYRVNASLSTPAQYKLPVFLAETQIQSISSMFLQPGSDANEIDIYLLLGDDREKTWIARIQNSDQHSIRDLSFGTKSRITQQASGDLNIFFQNSYAHGGLLINNNGENKCLYHRSSSLKNLATIPNLVDGLKASLKDLLDFAEDQSAEIATACHPRLTFSKYLNGADIQAQSAWDQVFLSTKRIPINQQNFITTLFSGGSGFERTLNTKKGFLISSVTSIRPLAHPSEPLFSIS